MKFDQAFYQFVLAVLALLMYTALAMTGTLNEAKGIEFILNALIGAGVWGGIQQRVNDNKIVALKNESDLVGLNKDK